MNSEQQHKALLRFGERHQLMKAAEEAAELAAAIIRHLNDETGSSVAQVVEEAADVEICGFYLREVFGGELIDKAIAFKLERLKRRLS